MPRIIEAFAQFFDANGAPLSRGQLRFYEAGTTNDKDTFQDNGETVLNTNPVILDGEGRAPDIFGTGRYAAVLFDADGVQIDEFDPIGQLTSTNVFDDWDTDITYDDSGDSIVTGSDGRYYRSLVDNNLGNDPVSSPEEWEQIRFLSVYNQFVSYGIGDVAQTTDGQLWRSRVDPNIGNDPLTDDGTNWVPTGRGDWYLINSAVTLIPGADFIVDATAATIDLSYPTIAAGDMFTVHVNANSTFQVRILTATGLTIRGAAESVTDPDNLIVEAGDTARTVAVSTTTLEVV